MMAIDEDDQLDQVGPSAFAIELDDLELHILESLLRFVQVLEKDKAAL